MRNASWLLAGVLWVGAACGGAAETEAEHFVLSGQIAEASFTSGGPSNLFPMAKGFYNGLLVPTNTFVPEHSGAFQITVFSDRYFSGRMNVAGGDSIPLRGRFDRQGSAGFSIYRRVWDDCFCSYELRLIWNVTLELLPGTNVIQGTVENARRGWSTELFGFKARSRDDGAAPQARRYTMRLPGSDDPVVAPGGEGYALIKVDSRGKVAASGALADGAKFSRNATVSTNGWWPFYVALNDGRGAVIGWLNFAKVATNDMVSGDLLWVRPVNDERQYYPNGYSGTIAASGARYDAPSSGALALNWSDGVFRLTGGNLSSAVSNHVALGASGFDGNTGAITNLTFSLERKTGAFRGKFIHPVTGRRTSYAGALNQLEQIGAGYFLGLDQGGLVRLEADP